MNKPWKNCKEDLALGAGREFGILRRLREIKKLKNQRPALVLKCMT
jgi:hypothetical protein